MKIVAPISEKKIKTLQKSSACGVVPGLWVKVVPLKNGELAKYFVLRERSINRTFNLGKYPDMSLAEAFKKAAEWKEKVKQGVDRLEVNGARPPRAKLRFGTGSFATISLSRCVCAR